MSHNIRNSRYFSIADGDYVVQFVVRLMNDILGKFPCSCPSSSDDKINQKIELNIRLEKLLELRRQLQTHYSEPRPLSETKVEQPMTKEDLFMKKLRKTIEENLADESFGVVQLYREMGMSRSQLYNKINALTGRSASLFVRSVRLEKAKQLLLTTDLNISEVAYEVGFRTPVYFTQAFTEEAGMAPSVFRKKE